MKRLILLSIFLIFIFNIDRSFAQDITPNAGFENWGLDTCINVFEVPVNWDQLNCATNFIGILTCVKSTDTHSGSFAAKLVTKYVDLGQLGQDTANGIIVTGHLITLPPYGVYGGIPTHERPDSIYGWIKYQPVSGDSCQIEFDLRTAGGDTIGKALFKTGTTLNTYTRFSAPVNYFSSQIPDTSLWLISSSNGFNAIPNSTLYVDDIGVVAHTGINEVSIDDIISLSPNPSNDFLYVKNEKLISGELIFYGEAGKKFAQRHIQNSQEEIDVSHFPEGIYLVQLMDEKNHLSSSVKMVIQR